MFYLQTAFNAHFFDESLETSEQVLPKLVGVDLNQIVEDATIKVGKRFDHVEPYIYKNSKQSYQC